MISCTIIHQQLMESAKLLLDALELTAATSGLYHWKKWGNTVWRWFTVFLVFNFLSEMVGKYLYHTIALKQYNSLWYRYVNIPATFLFYQWLLKEPLKKHNWVPLFFMVFYVTVFIAEEFFLPPQYRKFGTLSYQTGTLAILVLTVLFFVNLMRSEAILEFKTNIRFWVSAGLLFYFIVTMPFNAMRNLIFKQYFSLGMAYWYVTMLFNCTMYTFFSLGFLWAKPKS